MISNKQEQISSSQLDVAQLDSQTDEQLMSCYRDGEAAAFDLLYARHKGSLYRYLLRHTGQQMELVNELFQDIWMSLIKSRNRYQAKAKFNTYLYRIAHNRLVDHWRSHHPDRMANDDPDQLESAQQQPDQQFDITLQGQRLKQQIAALPQEQRNALLLKEEASLSLAQIAEVTGVNTETVKSRLRYAVQRLRQALLA